MVLNEGDGDATCGVGLDDGSDEPPTDGDSAYEEYKSCAALATDIQQMQSRGPIARYLQALSTASSDTYRVT